MGLLYLDIDAHHPWQTDEYIAKKILQDIFPFGFYRASRRGHNGFLKIRYDSIDDFNDLAVRLERTLMQWFLSLGLLCDIEIKGTITTEKKSGSLAKTPFSRHRFPCNRRDETDDWNYPQLAKFQACPVVNLRRVEHIMGQIEIDEDKVVAFGQHKKRLDDEQKAADEAKKAKKVENKPAPSIAIPKPVVIQSKPSVKLSPVRLKMELKPFDSEDAFRRNLEDLRPFVRAFFSQHRRFPATDEALDWLRDNGRYSGEWEYNFNRRAKRVEQILRFTERTFDPEMLGSDEHVSVSLDRKTFSWWVRHTFGSTMSAQVKDLRKFDPVTMAVPTKTVSIPAKFVETFLVVAEFCLQQDPLSNQAVPTTRMKKIWGMVKDGAPWNQKYFQIVRDRLHRMGVIRIFDRQHSVGKAWRWESGDDFPEESLGEQQRKLREKCELPAGDPISLVEFLSDIRSKNNNLHNTLYYDETQISAICLPNLQIRPPP